MTYLDNEILTNAKCIHMAFHELVGHTAYHDSIHCINEFISTYDAFCSLLIKISTEDFNNITGFLE